MSLAQVLSEMNLCVVDRIDEELIVSGIVISSPQVPILLYIHFDGSMKQIRVRSASSELSNGLGEALLMVLSQ